MKAYRNTFKNVDDSSLMFLCPLSCSSVTLTLTISLPHLIYEQMASPFAPFICSSYDSFFNHLHNLFLLSGNLFGRKEA